MGQIYRCDFAYWAGLLVMWELLVVLIALWLVPGVGSIRSIYVYADDLYETYTALSGSIATPSR